MESVSQIVEMILLRAKKIRHNIWEKLVGINTTWQGVEGYTIFVEDGLIAKIRRDSDGFEFNEPFTGYIDDGKSLRLVIAEGHITNILDSFGPHAKGCRCS